MFLSRLELHYTPKHASWLNLAEIEIGILDRQCTGRRIGDEAQLRSEVLAWSNAGMRRDLALNGSSPGRMPTGNCYPIM